jgi:uncharacterized protein YukE
MATLHMDVEVCRSTQSNIVSQQQQMVQTLQQVTNSINSVIGSAWIGNSANEFQQQYEQLRTSINNQLEQLQQLATNLNNEISQWEEMAARMG